MDAEFLQLAREAVDALQGPSPAEWAQVGIGIGQLILIGGGLWQMSQSGKRRDRALDQQGEALRQQGEALRTLIERTGPDRSPSGG